MYDNVNDAERYLSNSIIRLGNKPICVTGVNVRKGLITLYGFNVDKAGNPFNIPIIEEDLNFNPVPLGYSHMTGLVYRGEKISHYLFREPSRSWKQGLSPRTLKSPSMEGVRSFENQRIRCILNRAIRGVKTPFELALEGKNAGILSRSVAIGMRPIAPGANPLMYKGIVVGKVEKKEVFLNERYSYLDKFLEETCHVRTRIIP